MNDDQRREIARRFEEVEPVVDRVLRRKFRVSLSAEDSRRENLAALDCRQSVYLELLQALNRVLSGESDPIENFSAYAARVAYHSWAERIRGTHPDRSRLKNRLRRFLTKHPEFGIWNDEQGSYVCGLARWSSDGRSLATDRAVELASDPTRLPKTALPQIHWENMGAAEWSAALGGVFHYVKGPLDFDGLVDLVARMVGVAPLRMDAFEGDEESAEDYNSALTAPGATPEEEMAVRQTLETLWNCIGALRREWLLAFLLNPPSLRKDLRGELDVFVIRGVTSVRQMGRATGLSTEDYRAIFDDLGVASGGAAEGAEPFALLWNHLPLRDSLIGRVLGKTQMQVIGLRRLATRQLARCVHQPKNSSGDDHMPGERTSESPE